MPYNETGHASNVASFEDLIIALDAMNATYKPVAADIQLPTLKTLKTKLQQNLQAVNDKEALWRDKIYTRQNAFEKMSALSTRIVATMAGLGLDVKILTQARNILNKIRGGGAKKKTETPVAGATATETPAPAPKKVSVSQMGFDQRKNNFSSLLSLLAAQPNYLPNEEDVKLPALQTYLDSLQNVNTEATTAEQALTIARQKRDELLYKPQTGAIVLAQQVKAYIKGAFGVKSNEYKRVKGIKFSKIIT